MSKEIDDIRRRAGITEVEIQKDIVMKDPAAQMVWAKILDAMEDAESMGGPEGDSYVRLMKSIAEEALKRAKTAAAWHREDAITNAQRDRD